MKFMKKIKLFAKEKFAKSKEATLSAFQRFKMMKAALAALLFAFSVQAHAAVPDEVKTAIAGAKDDGLEAGWIVVAVIAALFVIKIVKGIIR